MKETGFTISPLGDTSLIVDFKNEISKEVNMQVLRLFKILTLENIPGVNDLVPCYSSLAVFYDIHRIKKLSDHQTTAFNTLKNIIVNASGKTLQQQDYIPRKLKVPVCYDAKYSLDAEDILNFTGLSKSELINLHTQRTYTVYMVGFLPGFPYMGEVHNKIAVSRKSSPRLKVEAGSVGIAGVQTGIYPFDSPGGWQIVGKTPLVIFDNQSDQPSYFQPGDQVSFFSITEDEFANY